MIALLLATAASFPAPAQAAIAIDDATGLRAFLDGAGAYARSLKSEEVGRGLKRELGVDPLTSTGPRTIVFSRRATGLIATMEPSKARSALAAWKRSGRVGLVAKGRLYTATGPDAQALLKALQREKPLRTRGPVTLWFALAPPLRTATFTLQASGQGLTAAGVVTASKPILQGPEPARCEGAPMGCLSAGLGPAGAELLMRALLLAGRPTPRTEAPNGTRFAARLDGFDVAALGNQRSVPDAARYAAAFDAPGSPADAQCQTPQDLSAIANPRCARLPSLDGTAAGADAMLDLAQVEAALSRLTALDALKGEAAAGAYATHLLYGQLLRHLGPLTLHGQAAKNDAAAAELSLQLPLH